MTDTPMTIEEAYKFLDSAYDVSQDGYSHAVWVLYQAALKAQEKPVDVTPQEWFDLWRENNMNTAQDIYKGKETRGADGYANNMGLILKHRYPNGLKIIDGDK